jgi:hypothetical protein
MQSKILGYVLGVAGILVLSLTIKPIRNLDFLPKEVAGFLATQNYIVLGVGIILIAVAFIFLKRSMGEKQPAEVPIYHGKSIVGYRRMGKK